MRAHIVSWIIVGVLMLPVGAAAQNGILADAERLAAEFELQPVAASVGGRSMVKIATTLGLIGAGVGLAAMAKPDYVPSQFAPGNTPTRVDLTSYLGPGNYPGHSYRLVHRRGNKYRYRWTCTGGFAGHCATNRMLTENYDDGYTDGVDDGVFAGLVVGHERGWLDGQDAVIQIRDANGLTVYSGEFTPASYVKERFSDKAGMRIGGVGLAAAGALVALFWPDSPVRNLDLGYMPGGARVGASFGF